eukprot:scaffold10981_cov66-Skeletonema_marinoi.AAC.2
MPPPGDGTTYTEAEVLRYAVERRKKADAINAIIAGPFKPTKSVIQRWFDNHTKTSNTWEPKSKYTEKAIELILGDKEVGSKDWIDMVQQISVAQHGLSVAIICKQFGGRPLYDDNGQWTYRSNKSTPKPTQSADEPIKCSTTDVSNRHSDFSQKGKDATNIISPTHSERGSTSLQPQCSKHREQEQQQHFIDVQIEYSFQGGEDKENEVPLDQINMTNETPLASIPTPTTTSQSTADVIIPLKYIQDRTQDGVVTITLLTSFSGQ